MQIHYFFPQIAKVALCFGYFPFHLPNNSRLVIQLLFNAYADCIGL